MTARLRVQGRRSIGSDWWGMDEHVGVDPSATFERIALDATSWVDVSRGWLVGADAVFEHLLATVPWQKTRLFRYEQFEEEIELPKGSSPSG